VIKKALGEVAEIMLLEPGIDDIRDRKSVV
jgi:hypothetical protein